MVIAIYLVLIFLIFIFIKAFKQKITWCFSCYLFGVLLLLTATIFYMAKFSYYNFPLSIDYSIYLWISKIKIRISSISRIYNAGVSLIIFVPCMLYHILGRKNYFRDVLLFLPVPVYFIYNDYNTTESFYLLTYSPNAPSWLGAVLNIGRLLCLMLIIVSMMLSLVCFAVRIKRAKHFYAKRENTVCLICMAVLDLFVAVFFMYGSFRGVNPYYVSLLKYPVYDLEWDLFLLPISLMAALIMILAAFTYFQPFSQLVIFRKKNIYKNNKKLNKSTRMIFHTYKNSFVAIAKLAEIASEMPEEEHATTVEILNKIKESAQSSVNNISGIIDSLGDIKMSIKNISASDAIRAAIKQSAVPKNIELTYERKCGDIVFPASENHIVAMIGNIITNAIEAININEISDGKIAIKLDCDDEYIYIEISDNGPGIKHSDLKNIFKPLFSGKSGSKNFGLGLTYVEKVVKAHYGYINVSSKLGEGTSFRILLPTEKKGEREYEKNQSYNV